MGAQWRRRNARTVSFARSGDSWKKEWAAFSRKDLHDLTEVATTYGAKGLAWVKITSDGWQSPIAKFLSDTEKENITKAAGAADDLDKVGAGDVFMGLASAFRRCGFHEVARRTPKRPVMRRQLR